MYAASNELSELDFVRMSEVRRVLNGTSGKSDTSKYQSDLPSTFRVMNVRKMDGGVSSAADDDATN